MRTPLFLTGLLATLLAAGSALAEEKLPERFVDRPLTLPKMMLAPELDLAFSHLEFTALGVTAAANEFSPSLGASLGITRDFQVDLVPLTMAVVAESSAGISETKAYYGTFRLGATYRFLDTTNVEMGGRLEFGASDAGDFAYLTGGVPVIFRVPHVLRIDTGLFFTGLFPTKSGSQADIAMASVGTVVPLVPGTAAGIPFDLTFQFVPEVFGGVDLGFGIASFRGSVDQHCFMPLGFHVGATVISDRQPRADIVGSFSFPLFLVGADGSPPFTQLWQVGLSTRVYLPL